MKLNQVICGDCLEVMKDIPDKSIDMILCDLPYGTAACRWDVVIPFEPLWEQYKRIIKDNGAIVLTASQPFTSYLIMSNIKWFKYELIWEKEKGSDFGNANIKPMKAHENIIIFANGKTIYNKQYKKGTPYERKPAKNFIKGQRLEREAFISVPRANGLVNKTGDRVQTSVIKISRDNISFGTNLHPTQKPVALFEYLIKTYTNEGDLVLDNCAGSGTTAIACLNTNRNYILIEKEPEYIEIINNRINNLPNKLF